MDMDGSTNSTGSLMGMFHTTIGQDMLWFDGWQPTSSATTFAASFGLFLLAVLSRFLNALKAQLDHAWKETGIQKRRDAFKRLREEPRGGDGTSTNIESPNSAVKRLNTSSNSPSSPSSSAATLNKRSRSPFVSSLPPFMPVQDIARGIFLFFQSGILYFLMLAVMTGSVWFFLAIIVGFGIGETAFGRFASAAHEGHGVVHG